MAITQQEQDKAQGDFAEAFDEPTPAVVEQSEDEAFGLSPEMPGDTAGEGEPPVDVIDEEPAADPVAEAPPEEMPAEPVAEEATPEGEGAAEGLDIEEAAESPAEEAAEHADVGAEVEAAIKMLSDDFGPEFVNAIKLVATHCAGQKTDEIAEKHVGAIGQTLDAIIADLSDGKAKAHFKEIKAAHPDFDVVSKSDEFAGWLNTLPEAERAEADAVIDHGQAEDVIQMLTKFKQAAGGQDEADEFDAAADAAEGVRSSGMRLPEAPTANDEYADAWEKA